jgi:flagellar FliL protein
MADAEEELEEEPKKASKLPLVIGVVLALVGGGGGFYATWSGMLLGPEKTEEVKEEKPLPKGPEVAYVEVDPLVISLRPPATAKHLRFRASLEVVPEAKADVEKLLPRVTDVLNSYLRALEPRDLEDPSALTRMRAQVLRRVQVVTGAGKVNDLLIMEFVLN